MADYAAIDPDSTILVRLIVRDGDDAPVSSTTQVEIKLADLFANEGFVEAVAAAVAAKPQIAALSGASDAAAIVAALKA